MILLVALTALSLGQVDARLVYSGHSPFIANLSSGQLIGLKVLIPTELQLADGSAFFGIKYGALYNNELRFKPPKAANQPWLSYKRLTLHPKRPCSQPPIELDRLKSRVPRDVYQKWARIKENTTVTEEDCLTLNIIRPDGNGPFPVVLVVTGDSFDNANPNDVETAVFASFARAVVVTVNHRLGALGFLGGHGISPSNFALFDLLNALIWIKKEISSFSGDPAKVTCLGHGHGASLVQLLLMSPKLKSSQYCSKAMLFSGSALSSWSMAYNIGQYTTQLVISQNCSSEAIAGDIKKIEDCLNSRTAKQINTPRRELRPPKYLSGWGPSVDSNLISEHPKDALRNPDTSFANVPLMVGFVRNEAYHFLSQLQLDEGISKEDRMRMLRTYVQNIYKYKKDEILATLDVRYQVWSHPASAKTYRDQMLSLLADGQYRAPLIQVARAHADFSELAADGSARPVKPTYLFELNAPSRPGIGRSFGSVHGDILFYLFGGPFVGFRGFTAGHFGQQEKLISKQLMAYVSNFIRSGNPNLPLQERNRVSWPAFQVEGGDYLEIGEQVHAQSNYRGDYMAIWLNLIQKLHKQNGLDARSHQLTDADDRSTFDDGTLFANRLLLPPPTPPIGPPPFGQRDMPSAGGQGKRPATTTLPAKPPSAPGALSTIGPGSSANGGAKQRTSKPNKPQPDGQTQVDEEPISKLNSTSLWLSIVIAVGLSLLFVNGLIFVAICWWRKRVKQNAKQQTTRASSNESQQPFLNSQSTIGNSKGPGQVYPVNNVFTPATAQVIYTDHEPGTPIVLTTSQSNTGGGGQAPAHTIILHSAGGAITPGLPHKSRQSTPAGSRRSLYSNATVPPSIQYYSPSLDRGVGGGGTLRANNVATLQRRPYDPASASATLRHRPPSARAVGPTPASPYDSNVHKQAESKMEYLTDPEQELSPGETSSRESSVHIGTVLKSPYVAGGGASVQTWEHFDGAGGLPNGPTSTAPEYLHPPTLRHPASFNDFADTDAEGKTSSV